MKWVSFNRLLIRLTRTGPVAGWVLQVIFGKTRDGPSCWQALIHQGRYPPGRYRRATSAVFLAVGAIGARYLP
jgi:hypothetical protein